MKTKIIMADKVWDKATVKTLLKDDAQALYRSIILIYSQQTPIEQTYQTTQVVNGLGFNAYDAEFLTSVAKKLQEKQPLTMAEFVQARNRMMKYAGQLLKLTKANINKINNGSSV